MRALLIFVHPSSTRLLLHFKELKFQHFELQEPLFCMAALYDAATRTRISENFHFDLKDAGPGAHPLSSVSLLSLGLS